MSGPPGVAPNHCCARGAEVSPPPCGTVGLRSTGNDHSVSAATPSFWRDETGYARRWPTIRLDPDVHAAGVVRAEARLAMRIWRSTNTDNVVLACSELVSAAVARTNGPVCVDITLERDT